MTASYLSFPNPKPNFENSRVSGYYENIIILYILRLLRCGDNLLLVLSLEWAQLHGMW